jgi:uncharacterized membrane protein YbaN (DUF454 family)
MHPLILPSILVVAGLYFMIRNIKYLRDQPELESYLATSPTGKAWCAKYGQEKTVELSNKYFLPLGIIVSVVMLLVGSWSFYKILPTYL